MQLEFVNHASIVTEANGIRLVSDPWIEGRVFNGGWDLLSPSGRSFDGFRDLTHIWFSHEHPDHFFPPNLKKIPEEDRARLQVLFQETNDKKVVRFCEKNGFGKVTELPAGQWVDLASDFKILNRPLGTEFDADSWLCLRTPDCTFLNINDCGVGESEARRIKRDVGEVDVLATQFSYAAWIGNVEAVEERQRRARKVMDAVAEQIAVFAPRYVIPFASFVWFCTEDNFYLNADMNRIRDVFEHIRTRTDAEPIVMYPGDRWSVGDPHDSISSIERYERDLALLDDPVARPRTQHEDVAEEVLLEEGKKFRDRLMELGDPLLIHLYLAVVSFKARRVFGAGLLSNFLNLARGQIEPARIYVTDLDASFTFDWRHGLRRSKVPRQACDIRLPSWSLVFCFRFPWGGETLKINGCFQENDGWRGAPFRGHANRFFLYCNLARRANLGNALSWRRAFGAAKHRLPVWGHSSFDEM